LGNDFTAGFSLTDIYTAVNLVNANFPKSGNTLGNNGFLVFSCADCPTAGRIGLFNDQSNVGKVNLTSYPNPFNDNTTIEFTLTYDSPVTVEIYNFEGERVSTLFSGNVNAANRQIFNLNGTNLTEGVYYCKLVTNQGTTVNKLILAK